MMDPSGYRSVCKAGRHAAAVRTESLFAGAIRSASVDVVGFPAGRSTGQQHFDHPPTLVPLTVKQVTMLAPSIEQGGAVYSRDACQHGMHDRDAVLVGFLVFSSEKPHTVLLQARLLGRMLNRRDMPEEIEFILADGTGAIQARIWTAQSEYMLALRSVSDGDYMIVNGSIKAEGSLKHIRVYSLSVVTNYNAITHHFLQCIYVHLDLRKKAWSTNLWLIFRVFSISSLFRVRLSYSCVFVQFNDRENDIRRMDLAVAAHEQSSPVLDINNRLFDDVLRVFYHPGVLELENGASFALIQSQTGADADQLRSVIGAHVAMGNLFTTIDDGHYKCSFNG
ncbi:replication protein A 32 kDa subunit B isoform X2 [Triticum aestivum]|uniref:replication protein A 32 kDa subunit B isoform X2 n=1 Tax=Triticum aestivum TaxID=4565 RepID=UPI001D01D10F|nr:replication protein A 32 kDa subunit B-like isoform X2 [Triticum aestivum]